MIDTGAMVSVISTALANFSGIIEENKSNVMMSKFRVRGIGDNLSGAAVIATQISFGTKESPERKYNIQLCAIESQTYKLILGLDILEKLKAQIDLENYRIRLRDRYGKNFTLELASQYWARKQLAMQEFYAWRREERNSQQEINENWVELNELEIVADVAGIINSVPRTAVKYLGTELSQSLRILEVLQVGCTTGSESDEEEVMAPPVQEKGDVPTEQGLFRSEPGVEGPFRIVSSIEGHSECVPAPRGRSEYEPSSLGHSNQQPLHEPHDSGRRGQQVAEVFEAETLSHLLEADGGVDMPKKSMLNFVKSLNEMGSADLPRRRQLGIELSEAELANFYKTYQIQDKGDPSSAAERAGKTLKAIQETPEIICPDLKTEQKNQIMELLYKYANILAASVEELHPPADCPPLVLKTTGGPVKQRWYRLDPQDTATLKDEIDAMVAAKIASVSGSAWGSPAFIAHAEGHRDRKVGDYRLVNSMLIPDVYPLPDIHGVLDLLGDAHYFGCADLKAGFWQVMVHEESIPITAFCSVFGLHEYNRAPFGIKNCPAHFMRVMNQILDTQECRGGGPNDQGGNTVFVDDVTTYARDFLSYLLWQEKMFRALAKKRWRVNPKKLRLGYQVVQLLGFVVGGGMLRPDPKKIDAVRKLAPPTNVKQLRAFLGLTGFYHRLIPAYAQKAVNLTKLLKKDKVWEWGEKETQAWVNLKAALTADSVVRLPSGTGKFKIYTDWSAESIGAILHQQQADGEYPIVFASRQCRGPERNLCSAEGELLAVVYALQKFQQYVGRSEFDLITDSKALTYLQTTKNLGAKLARWAVFLGQFNFQIHHKAGTSHKNADGLSRCPSYHDDKEVVLNFEAQISEVEVNEQQVLLAEDTGGCIQTEIAMINITRQEYLDSLPCSLCGIFSTEGLILCDGCDTAWHLACVNEPREPSIYWYCQTCRNRQHQNQSADPAEDVQFLRYLVGRRDMSPELQEEFARLSQQYSFRNGRLWVDIDGKELIVPSPATREDLLTECHRSYCHVGQDRMWQFLSERYWWPTIYRDIKTFCKKCFACQLQKAVFNREPDLRGHLTSLAPRTCWSLDCAPNVPVWNSGQGNERSNILICVDDFSKFVLITEIPTLNSSNVNQWFLRNIIYMYGKPKQVRTDSGVEFKGSFEQMCQEMSITHITTPVFAPWRNGRAERMVRFVKSLIRRIFIEEQEAGWREWLGPLQFAINSTVARSTGLSPNAIFFGADVEAVTPGGELAPPQLREGAEQSVQQYATLVREHLEQQKTQLLQRQEHYQQQLEQEYAAQPVHDGARNREPPQYAQGEIVMIRRGRGHHFGVKARGPLVVQEDMGASVKLTDLSSGRVIVEAKPNVKKLSLGV